MASTQTAPKQKSAGEAQAISHQVRNRIPNLRSRAEVTDGLPSVTGCRPPGSARSPVYAVEAAFFAPQIGGLPIRASIELAQLPQGLKKIGGRAIFSDAVLT